MRLLLHVGAGKTGTSSIQQTLRANDRALRAQGVLYLGLMLEHAPARLYPWQKPTGSEVFHHLPAPEAVEAVVEVLSRTAAAAAAEGIHTLVWSNESFFDRGATVRLALRDPRLVALDVRVVAYVRQPHDWLRSAYVQWGLKHKTYSGPLRTFRDWAAARLPRFADVVEDLQEEYGPRLVLRRHEPALDVVADFLSAVQIDATAIRPLRSNDSPPAHELVLRALYNARFAKKVLPQRFDRLPGPDGLPRGTAQDHLDALMGEDDDAARAIEAELAPGLARINELLEAAGQPPLPLHATARDGQRGRVDESRLLMLLCQIVVQQAVRIDRLEDEIEAFVPSRTDADDATVS
jgi:hypothetical protein